MSALGAPDSYTLPQAFECCLATGLSEGRKRSTSGYMNAVAGEDSTATPSMDFRTPMDMLCWCPARSDPAKPESFLGVSDVWVLK